MMLYSRVLKLDTEKLSVDLTCKSYDLNSNLDLLPSKDDFYDEETQEKEKAQEEEKKQKQVWTKLKLSGLSERDNVSALSELCALVSHSP